MWDRIRSVDCSHIKVYCDGANPMGSQASQAQGKTKGGLNTKLAAVADGVGRAAGLCLARGPQHNLLACPPLQEHLRARCVLADDGFDAASFRRNMASSGAFICIPPRTGRHTVYHYDRVPYRHRHTVENFFARIKRHRRIATRYEKLAAIFLGCVLFATVLDWLNHEA